MSNLLKAKKYFNNNKSLIVYINHDYQAFISVSMFSQHKCYRNNVVQLNHSIHYKTVIKKLFYYYIETFQPHDNFFDIFPVVSFLQTYYGFSFFHILSSYFCLLQISFYIYLLLALLIFLHHFYSIQYLVFLFSIQYFYLYLASHLYFFDSKFLQQIHSFFIHNKKKI